MANAGVVDEDVEPAPCDANVFDGGAGGLRKIADGGDQLHAVGS